MEKIKITTKNVNTPVSHNITNDYGSIEYGEPIIKTGKIQMYGNNIAKNYNPLTCCFNSFNNKCFLCGSLCYWKGQKVYNNTSCKFFNVKRHADITFLKRKIFRDVLFDRLCSVDKENVKQEVAADIKKINNGTPLFNLKNYKFILNKIVGNKMILKKRNRHKR
ncbi:MAG: hypothetical protein IKB42_00740 [Clostridia bacterium]|nr:hypothetical protein [Clostridia bacterium]